MRLAKDTPPSHQKSNALSLRYIIPKWVRSGTNKISYRVHMQDNLAFKNKYLRPFSMLPLLLKRIHTAMSVVPRLLYTGTKGRPE